MAGQRGAASRLLVVTLLNGVDIIILRISIGLMRALTSQLPQTHPQTESNSNESADAMLERTVTRGL